MCDCPATSVNFYRDSEKVHTFSYYPIFVIILGIYFSTTFHFDHILWQIDTAIQTITFSWSHHPHRKLTGSPGFWSCCACKLPEVGFDWLDATSASTLLPPYDCVQKASSCSCHPRARPAHHSCREEKDLYAMTKIHSITKQHEDEPQYPNSTLDRNIHHVHTEKKIMYLQ